MNNSVRRFTKFAKATVLASGLILGLAVGLALVMAAATLPSVLGYVPMVVLSGSMEPTLKVGDVAIARRVDPTTIHLGDVATYTANNSMITHRVVGIELQASGPEFHFKGDNNPTGDPQSIAASRVVGRVYYRIPWMGYFIIFASTMMGKLVLILIPFIGFILLTVRDRAKKTKLRLQVVFPLESGRGT